MFRTEVAARPDTDDPEWTPLGVYASREVALWWASINEGGIWGWNDPKTGKIRRGPRPPWPATRLYEGYDRPVRVVDESKENENVEA